jgi:hypothetical protein
MTQTKVEAPFVENSRPFRNLIINGDMQIAQRSTSTTGVANNSDEGVSTLDRWGLFFYGNEGGVATVSQDTTVPSDTTYGKFSKSLKIDVTTADTSIGATGAHALSQAIESSYIHHSGWDYTNSSSKITLSFWARSVKAGDYHILLQDKDVSGERYFVSKYTLVANTWKHVEVVIPGNSDLVFNDDNGEGLQVRWHLSAGDDRNDATAGSWFNPGSDYEQTTNTQVNFFDSTDNNFFLTGVQLEVGDAATNFEHLPRDVQLQRCYRYCQRHPSQDPTGGAYGVIASGHNSGTTAQLPIVHHYIPMRGDPSLTNSGNFRVHHANTNTATSSATTLDDNTSSPSISLLVVTVSSGLTVGQSALYEQNNDSDAHIILDAEF